MTQLPVGEDPIVLAASKRKAVLLLIVCGVFVAIGVFLIARGERLAWFGVAFFGLGVIVSVVLLLPGSTSLTIDRSGIRMTHMFRTTVIRWSDVDSFYVGFIRTGLATTKMIGINYAASYEGQQTGRKAALALTGMEGAIPNQYQVSPEELCELLNAAKRRWRD